MREDMISELKIIPLFSVNQSIAAVGVYRGDEVDLQSAMSGNHDLREHITNILLAIDLNNGAAGTVDIIIRHRNSQSDAWTTYATLAQIAADGQWIAEIRNCRRYVQVQVTVGTNTVTLSIIGIGNRAQAVPVAQSATELTPTYNSTP